MVRPVTRSLHDEHAGQRHRHGFTDDAHHHDDQTGDDDDEARHDDHETGDDDHETGDDDHEARHDDDETRHHDHETGDDDETGYDDDAPRSSVAVASDPIVIPGPVPTFVTTSNVGDLLVYTASGTTLDSWSVLDVSTLTLAPKIAGTLAMAYERLRGRRRGPHEQRRRRTLQLTDHV